MLSYTDRTYYYIFFVDNRFLLVEFQKDHIERHEPIKVPIALETLPISQPKLYDEMLEQIRANPNPLPLRIVSWVFYSQPPLRIDELLEALVVQKDQKTLPTDNIYQPDILEDCQGLVVCDRHTKVVNFVHETVREYIRERISRKKSGIVLPEGPADLAQTCLHYLGFEEFQHCCTDELSLKKRLDTWKFSAYVSQHWGFHTKGDPEGLVEIQKSVIKTLTDEDRLKSMIQIRKYILHGRFCVPQKACLFHAIAWNGLSVICKLLLECLIRPKMPYASYRYES